MSKTWNTVEVRAQTLDGRVRLVHLNSPSTLKELRAMVSETVGISNLKIIRNGETLSGGDDDEQHFASDDLLLVMPQRRAPAQHIQNSHIDESDGDKEWEELARFQLPDNAPRWQRAFVQKLRTWKCPDALLIVLFGVKGWVWAAFALWLLCAPLAERVGVGPIYILGTIILLIALNLGKRKEGEASAYSIFNEGVRALPGQLTADDIDGQIRRGQLH